MYAIVAIILVGFLLWSIAFAVKWTASAAFHVGKYLSIWALGGVFMVGGMVLADGGAVGASGPEFAKRVADKASLVAAHIAALFGAGLCAANAYIANETSRPCFEAAIQVARALLLNATDAPMKP